jgi:hypothetical protein
MLTIKYDNDALCILRDERGSKDIDDLIFKDVEHPVSSK